MLTWEKIPDSPCFYVLQATKSWAEPGEEANRTLCRNMSPSCHDIVRMTKRSYDHDFLNAMKVSYTVIIRASSTCNWQVILVVDTSLFYHHKVTISMGFMSQYEKNSITACTCTCHDIFSVTMYCMLRFLWQPHLFAQCNCTSQNGGFPISLLLIIYISTTVQSEQFSGTLMYCWYK